MGSFESASVQTVAFDDLDTATAEYGRIVDLLKRRDDKANDLPKVVELKGVNEASVPLNSICSRSALPI